MVETQSGQKVKVLRTSNGGKYTSKEFNVFCQEAGIVHQLTTPYSLQQNGVSERKNRTVMEMARCMLFEKKLPKLLWVAAVSTSVYLLNRLPTKSVQSKTPIEAWSGKTICQALESVWFIVLPSCAIYQERDVHFDENSYWNWDLKKVHKCDQTTPSILEPVEDPLDVEATSDTPVLKKVCHLDVQLAFLNGILLEEIYVQQPEGFEVTRRSANEATLYLKQNEDGLQLVVSLYVDDMLVTRSNLGYLHFTEKYVVDILKKFKLESCKEVATPLTQNEKISKNDGEKLKEPSAYRSLVGGVKLDGYADSDWAGSVDDMKSTSGYVFTIGSGVVCWNSESQEQSSPTELYCDNKSAIAIASNLVQHGRTKHINVKFHSIREAEKNSLVKLHSCSTDVQLADIMTKALPKSRLELLRLKLGMSKANLKEEC
ncbi:Retrovirus-related Pol polyprotein from transposon TNT 1-94 [Vitis vinifera]|uniref:Retrovirus-related Pol polyprotein from transposon TNT 1-94 n=1 Tax=Vitis vinifera TaxID=29760 RepID=A0A438GVB3_VITVI|nr:Retrovirus-related Pol polyprotein from transposon TNT 1-94 [Vitis vinifera]